MDDGVDPFGSNVERTPLPDWNTPEWRAEMERKYHQPSSGAAFLIPGGNRKWQLT